DPVGFALENFNPVGQWRDTGAGGAPLDTAGVLADGSRVDGPVALRNVILSRPEAFVTALTERLMIYALGRGLEPADMPVIRRIVRTAARSDYRLSAIVTGIVESRPFQMRTKLEPAGEAGSVAAAAAAGEDATRSAAQPVRAAEGRRARVEQPCSSRRCICPGGPSCAAAALP